MQPTTVVDNLGDATLQDLLTAVDAPPPRASLEDAVFLGLDYARLAREIARRIHPAVVLAQRFGLSEPQFVLLLKHTPFVRMIKIEQAVWADSGNAGERARTYHREAQAMVASDMVAIIGDPNTAMASRIEVMKLSARIAGIDRDPPQAGGQVIASSFAVNIHLGEGRVERIGAPLTLDGAAA